eukprot:UN04537
MMTSSNDTINNNNNNNNNILLKGKFTPDLRAIKNIKLLYLYTHRGALSHGHHALNLVNTYLTHYHPTPLETLPASTAQTSATTDATTNNNNTTTTTTTTTATTSAVENDAILNSQSTTKLFLDYILSLYKHQPNQVYRDPKELQRKSQTESNTNNTTTTTTATNQSVSLEMNTTQPFTLQSKITLPTTIISEIIYWARPVVYTALTIFCNRIPQTADQYVNTPWYSNLLFSYRTSLQSAIPTIVSMIMDFLALYLSPAWDGPFAVSDR